MKFYNLSLEWNLPSVNIKNALKDKVADAFLPNLDSAEYIEGGVSAKINIKSALIENIEDPEVLAEVNKKEKVETCYILQFSKEYMRERDLNDILRSHFIDGFNATSVDILQHTQWPYFYRWSPEEMDAGRLWQVYHIQGQQRTWFVGSSVLHESTRAVTEYINLLFRNMIPHNEFYATS